MGRIFNNIFKRNKEQTSNVVQKSESTKTNPPLSALLYAQRERFDALRLSAVYAALSLISNSIATMPIYVKQRRDNSRTVVENHTVQKLFYSMLQSKHTVMKQIVLDLYLCGNSYIYIKRVDKKPVKLIYLQSLDVVVDYDKINDTVTYQVSNHNAVPQRVQQQDMLHFARDTRDGVMGRPITLFARDIIDLSGFTQQAAENFFASGCNLTGILQFKTRLRDEQKTDIRNQWVQIHSSGSNGAGLAVLEGDSEYIPISQNSSEAQMVETREFNITEIARYFNINPVLLGDLSHSSYNTIEDANIEFIQRTLLPIINLLEEEINRKLITNRNQYVDIDETELLKGDKTTLANYYSTLVSNGIITIDEARIQLGWNPFNDGYSDKILIPFTKISDNVINQQNDNSEDNKEDTDEQENSEDEKITE